MTNPAETMEFQAEVKKLLDIVIHSLYTERDIFLRELISNSADALEKFRHQRLQTENVFDADAPLEITVAMDADKHILTITDSGIGMSRDELIHNLGTIAHSGSKTFLTELAEAAKKDVNLIGQFGVGFYSVFMAAQKVTVQSRSYLPEDAGHEWSSDGTGNYTIADCPGLHRGTKIIIELKDDAHSYCKEENVKRIIKQYSNFVPFPIKVNGTEVNTVQAVWTRNKNEISADEYNEFYKFIANAVDEPLTRLHFSADAPLAIKTLLFVGQENFERLGFGRMKPGVNLYCQRILIEQHSESILPEWLRFVKGVVDSEDLPLNISRQALQDSSLVTKLKKIVTSRFLKHLEETAAKEADTYEKFYKNFGIFLKEGATMDYTHQEQIAKLLRFESSTSEAGKMVSLAEYVERMGENQKDIYYINGPSREAIESGPYVEAFVKESIEVLYTFEPIDDFVFSHIREFDGKKLTSADRSDIEIPHSGSKDADPQDTAETSAAKLDSNAAENLTKWMKEVLGDRVKEVKPSTRLVGSPAMVVNPDGFMTSTMERVMQASGQSGEMAIGAKNLEINISHSLIVHLAELKQKDELFAGEIVQQIFDNALIQAGLLIDPRKMVERSYQILERTVSGLGAQKDAG